MLCNEDEAKGSEEHRQNALYIIYLCLNIDNHNIQNKSLQRLFAWTYWCVNVSGKPVSCEFSQQFDESYWPADIKLWLSHAGDTLLNAATPFHKCSGVALCPLVWWPLYFLLLCRPMPKYLLCCKYFSLELIHTHVFPPFKWTNRNFPDFVRMLRNAYWSVA